MRDYTYCNSSKIYFHHAVFTKDTVIFISDYNFNIQAHQNSGTVALYGCEVVYKITLNDPVGSGLGARLGSSGACEAIVR